MRLTVLCVGRIRAPFSTAQAHYLKMIGRRDRVEVVEVRDDDALAGRIDGRDRLVALTDEARQLDSVEWSQWLGQRRMEGRNVTFLIGGPEGLPGTLVGGADECLSLGRQTMAHQLARVVLLEQVFRAGKILAGEPYHL